jgi:cell division protein FtsZ
MQMGGGSLLAIGHGQGEGKALQAVERALHHPLIEAISLENATGIIANFTAGSDLTFVEVADALTYLQEKTNNHAEIIPGVIADNRMGDRVEVILVITGLGATPVQTPIITRKPQPEPVSVAAQPVVKEVIRQAAPPPPTPVEMLHQRADLDLPAFMRRRMR